MTYFVRSILHTLSTSYIISTRVLISLYHSYICFNIQTVSLSKIMALDNHWLAPALEVIKINVHEVVDDVIHPNGNMNNIGLGSRNHEGIFQWVVIGPFY